MTPRKEVRARTRIQRTLRKIGLPDTLFDSDFREQYQRAVETRRRLQQLAREVSNDARWKDCEIVQQLAAMPLDQPLPLTIVAGDKPQWREAFADWMKMYKHGFLRLNQEINRAKSYKRPPGRFTRRRALLIAAGYDPDNLHRRS